MPNITYINLLRAKYISCKKFNCLKIQILSGILLVRGLINNEIKINCVRKRKYNNILFMHVRVFFKNFVLEKEKFLCVLIELYEERPQIQA